MKEAKALLQFCSQQSTYTGNIMGAHNDSFRDDDNGHHAKSPWSVTMSFHWAGRPLIFESKSQARLGVSIQMGLATLDHNILQTMPQQRQRSQEQNSQRRRSTSRT